MLSCNRIWRSVTKIVWKHGIIHIAFCLCNMPSRQRSVSSYLPHLRILTEVRPPHVHQNHSSQRTLVIALAVSALGLLLVLVLLFLLWYHDLLKLRRSKTSPDDGTAFKLQKFSYRALKRATNSFCQTQKLGKGGFGEVYRGVLGNGKEIAVKRLDLSSFQGEKEFQNELSICGGLRSPHVVSLLGYCTHGRSLRLLVYECMQNRSLQEALFEKGYPVLLDWEKRFKIILDTAKALAFLHLECNPPVIHGDVKPSNILLDGNFSARIADFGLARLKTEDYWAESGRPSTSVEKFKRETPDRLRPGATDMLRHGRSDIHRLEISEGDMWRRSCKCQGEIRDKSWSDTFQELKKQAGETQSVIELASEKQAMVEEPMDPVDCDSVSCSASPHQLSSHSAMPASAVNETTQSGGSHAQSLVAAGNVSDGTGQLKDASFSGLVAEDVKCDKASPCERGHIEGLINGDGARDSVLLSSSSKTPPKKKLATKDWWWRQENSGDLSVKDYVMEWIGNELRSSGRSRNFKDDKHEEFARIGSHQLERKVEAGGRSESRPSEIKVELIGDTKNSEAKRRDRKEKLKHKKSREWWKDEYFAELSSKNKISQKGKGRKGKTRSVDSWKEHCSGELGSSCSGELRRIDYRSMRGRSGEKKLFKDWWRESDSGDLSFGREWRSGDLLNRQCSGELLMNRQWSGDLSRSGELLAAARDVSSTTSMRGTVCYVAPEYGGSGILSEKGDIYSLGVLMLVILSGRRPIQVTAASPMKEFERANLISWARSLAHQHSSSSSSGSNLLDLMDDKLHGNYNREQAHLSITLALSCLQRVPASRPSISEVVKILSGEAPAPSPPPEHSPSPTSTLSYRSPLQASSECLLNDTP